MAAGTKSDNRREKGQSMVEFALVLPLVLAVLFLMVDFGVGLSRWVIVTNATREGARLGAVCEDASTCGIQDRVATTSNGLIDPTGVTVYYLDKNGGDPGDRGDSVIVESTYEYDLITPLKAFLNIAFDSITFHSCTDMRLELTVDGASNPGGDTGC